LIDRMRTKLEVKAYDAAQQYFHMQNYQAASVALRNFNREWPNSRFREQAMLDILHADQELALNSIESKRRERLNEAIRSYRNFADAFPQSASLAEAERINKELSAALERENNRPTP
jgi:outer membrane protein assembly factor BamD